MPDNLDSDFIGNQIVGSIKNHWYLQKTTNDEQLKGGLAVSPKPLKQTIHKHTKSANSNMMTENVQRNPVYHAPYSEIYNMVVMKDTY